MTAISKICNLILWAAAAAVLSASCVRDEEGIDCAQMPEVTLRLSTVAANTRADESDNVEEDEYAQNPEESISRVDLFFYTSAESTDAAPLYVYETTLNATTKTDLTVKIPIELKQQFPDNKGYVYALVNLPAAVRVDASDKKVDGASATLENLQKVWVEENAFVGKDAPANFVMRGGGVITLQQSAGGATSASGTVLLERLASKIRLWASLPEVVYVDENGRTIVGDESDADWQERIKDAEKWVPIPSGNKADGSGSDEYEQMKLYIYNVATRGRLDATTTETGGLRYRNVERESGNKINEKARKLVKGDDLELPEADISEAFPYSHTTAYYSYPNVWDSTSPEEEHQTYVIVSLLWGRVGADNSIELYQPCYYQVPVNALKQSDTDAERDCLEPNKYYRIKVNISMLGSKDLGDPLPVDASWEVVDWVPAEVDVNIKDRRYLVVNEKNWVMNNASWLEIPFSSSHDVEVKCYVNYFRYNDIWGTAENTNDVHNLDEFDKWLDAATGQLADGKNGEGLITANYKAEYKKEDVTSTSIEISSSPTETVRVWVSSHWEGFDWVPGHYEYRDVYSKTIITTTGTMQYLDEQLYYKKDYFYDPIYQTSKGDGYRYYLGHEHPKTIQPDHVKYTDEQAGRMEQAERDAWDMYIKRYDMDAIYTCTVDEQKSVINFNHPLIQWREVRNPEIVSTTPGRLIKSGNAYREGDTYYQDYTRTDEAAFKGALQYYVPELNPHTNNSTLWDEFSRCEIIIEIKHKDWNKNDDLYRETIHITQYPAMYVEVSHDYGDIYVNETSRGNQYVFVNGNATERPSEDARGLATEWWETTSWVRYFGDINNNPNMYVIHTSQLSEDNEVLYDLGDPRMLHFNNLLSDDSMKKDQETENPTQKWHVLRLDASDDREEEVETAEDVWGVTRKMQYYYPTDETGDGIAGTKANFIAPSFRIASSFGKVSLSYKANRTYRDELYGASREEARRRCASYQEAGRPAGRWRVPTMAEIKYLVQLSADGKIPHLFGLPSSPNIYSPYWSATGIVGVRLSDSNVSTVKEDDLTTTPAVRCIYDEWYWTQIDKGVLPTPDKELEKKFYWGDIRKDNTQSKSIMQKTINKKPIQAVKKVD